MAEKIATVTYLGHSAVLVETVNGKRIVIDPWLDGNPSCPEAFKDPGRIDYICCTHGHSDHAGSALILAKSTGATVFAAWELCSIFVGEGLPESSVQRMNIGGTVRTAEIGVTLTPALHSSSYDLADGSSVYAGAAAGVVLHLPGGAIYHAGDTALFSDLHLVGRFHRPTLAFLPIGDRLTMGPREAAAAAAMIQPKTVIPIHHSTFPGLTGRPEEFSSALQKEAPEIRCEILAPGQSFDVAP